MGMDLEGNSGNTHRFNLRGWSVIRRLLVNLHVDAAGDWPTLNDGEPVSEAQASEAGGKLLEALDADGIRAAKVSADKMSPYDFVKSMHEDFVVSGSEGFEQGVPLSERDIKWLRNAADFFTASKGFKCY